MPLIASEEDEINIIFAKATQKVKRLRLKRIETTRKEKVFSSKIDMLREIRVKI